MRKTGQDARWGVAAVVGVLLLVFIGCTASLHDEPASPRVEAVANATVAKTNGAGRHDRAPAVAGARTAEQAHAGDGAVAASGLPLAAGTRQATLHAPPDAALTAGAGSPAFVDDGTLRVQEIRLTQRDGRTAIVAQLSRPPDDVRHFTLGSPSRIVIDLVGPVAPGTRATINPAVDPDVAAVRVGVYGGKLRLVADLNGPASDYVIERGEYWIAALLGPSYTGRTDEVLYTDPDATTRLASESLGMRVATDETTPADEPVPLASDASAPAGEQPASDATAEAGVDPNAAFEDDADPATDAPAQAAPERPAADQFRQQLASMDDREVVAETTTTVGHDGDPAAVAVAPEPYETAPAAVEAAAAREVEARAPVPARSFDDGLVHDAPAPRRFVRESAAPTDAELDALAANEPTAYALPVRATKKTQQVIADPYVPTSSREPHAYTGQKISLDFKDADIQNVLRIIADVSGLNIITTDDVSGKLTMRLVDVPWDQALDAMLRAKGLDMVRDGNIARVSTVEQLKKERDAQRAADEAQKQVEPIGIRYVKVNYAKADEKMVKKVQEVLTERGSATWDERTNIIVIRDIERGLDDASELITNFDTQTPQVLIESNIVEAQENFLRDLGIQWGYNYRAGPGTGNATGMNFPGRIGAGGVLSGGANSPANPALPFIADFPAAVAPGAGTAYDILLGSLDGTNSLSARLTALETKRKGKIISRPRVVTLNNVPAKIESVVIVRIKTPSSGTVLNNSTGAAGVAGSGAQAAFQEFRTGIVLDVTPQVSSDGYIFLDVHAKSSNLEGAQTDPNIIPNEISREANSHVLIKDGETFVLGGIFRNILNRSDRGVPFLHSIPVIGWAFKNDNTNDDRQELLVFITPRTIKTRGTETVASLPSAEALWQNRPNP